MDTGLRIVRFHSARASINATFLAGLDYQLPAAFAQHVVEVERVADYADGDATPIAIATGARETTAPKRRR